MRKLEIGATGAGLVNKQKITNIGNTLYLVEGAKILAYGEIIGGRGKVFHYTAGIFYVGEYVTTPLSLLTNLGSGILGFGYVNDTSGERFVTIDTTVALTTSSSIPVHLLRFNKYTFTRPIVFNAVEIEYGAVVPSDGSVIGLIAVRGDDNNAILLDGGVGISTTQAGQYQLTIPYPTIKTRSIQISYSFGYQIPIRRITVFYNDVE